MPAPHLGRPEPDGHRRLGSDLGLLGKWLEAATFARPTPQFPLSGLSTADQGKLFTKTKLDYKFAYQQDGSLKLEEIEVGAKREMDPDDRTMMEHDHSKRIEDRDDETVRATDDGIDEEFLNYRAMAICEKQWTKHAPPGAPAAVATYTKAVEKYRQERHTTQHKRAGQEDSIEEMLADLVRCSEALPYSRSPPRGPSKRPIGTKAEPATGAKISPPFYPASMGPQPAVKGSDSLSPSLDAKFDKYHLGLPSTISFPPPEPHTDFPFPSHSASPDHGSDTTHVNTPYFSDATLPSRRLSQDSDSTTDSVFDSVGGVVLDATAPVFHPTATPPWAPLRGGLGTGLSEAFRNHEVSTKTQAAPVGGRFQFIPGFHDSPLSSKAQQVSSPGLVDPLGTPDAAAATLAASYGTPGLSRPVFVHGETSSPTPHPKAPIFTVAKAQPYGGVTLYDVPGRRPDDTLVPAYWTTKEDKARLLEIKLQTIKRMDAKVLEDPATKVAASNIHVFVDLSNIVIGFYDTLKRNRGFSPEKRMKAPAFSFENFHTILSRGRKVEKRVVAGSRTAQKTPEYVRQAENLGYEMNLMWRVPKLTTRNGEQGVDELLHLKILQCPYDHDAGTIVLATGDAAEAEFSDGFKKNVERVLQCGWNLELYGWKKSISSAWRDAGFLAKLGDRFRIIELDQFAEELYEMTVDML